MDSQRNISEYLISEEEIRQRLASIFVDSFVLRTDFTIKVISKNLEELLEFSSEELQGKPIDYLSSHNDLLITLEHHLRKGYFEGVVAELITKSRVKLHVTISGFYLGLISDINGYIILKIRVSDDVSFLQKELGKKTRELDSFIYRTAHDLRGPLATMKGLINLMKMRESEEDTNELIRLIEVHAEKLDDRLCKLLYLADTDETLHPPKGRVLFSSLESVLRTTLENNHHLKSVNLVFHFPAEEVVGVNEFFLTALVNNLLLYIVGLPAAQHENGIEMWFALENDNLEVKINATGFVISPSARRALRQPSFLYNDMLTYPLLVNYYAAQKVAMQLGGLVCIDFMAAAEQCISISLPVEKEL